MAEDLLVTAAKEIQSREGLAPSPVLEPGRRRRGKVWTTLTVVLPALDERANLITLLPRLREVLQAQPHLACEILLVDDGSGDGTPSLAREFGARVVSHPESLGNGAAVKRGIREARGDWILLMDADGQHPPEEIPRLLEYLGDYDMVVGARKGGGSFHRNLANRVYNGLASYVTGRKIEDLTSGFRLVRRKPLLSFLYLLPNTFSYPTTITLAMIRAGYSVKYVPFLPARRKGNSKIRIFRDGSRFFLILLKITTLFSPLKVFLPLAFSVWTLGALYYVYTFLTSHRFTNMGVLLLVQGSILFFLGLVSEQVAQLRYERSSERGERES